MVLPLSKSVLHLLILLARATVTIASGAVVASGAFGSTVVRYQVLLVRRLLRVWQILL